MNEHLLLSFIVMFLLDMSPLVPEMVQPPGNTPKRAYEQSVGFNQGVTELLGGSSHEPEWDKLHFSGDDSHGRWAHGPWTSGESPRSVRGVLSATPPEALRPLGDVLRCGNSTAVSPSQGMYTSDNHHF